MIKFFTPLKIFLTVVVLLLLMASGFYFSNFNLKHGGKDVDNLVVPVGIATTTSQGYAADIKAVSSLVAGLNSDNVKIEDKVKIISNLKKISLDENNNKVARAVAGQNVVTSFFDYGMILSKGFSESSFSERDIYNYSKEINSLGVTTRLGLYTAYIALRFYPEEVDKVFVSDTLSTYLKSVNNKPTCNAQSKISSIIYLSQKNKKTDVSDVFGDYYANFEKAFNDICLDDNSKTMIGFMWLSAISDIGKTEKELKKGKELVSLITKNAATSSPVVRNLRQAYLGEQKETDTVSIVERIISKYPEFKIFIEKISADYKKEKQVQ